MKVEDPFKDSEWIDPPPITEPESNVSYPITDVMPCHHCPENGCEKVAYSFGTIDWSTHLLTEHTVPLLQAALHTVWMHGDWRALTRVMTTPEREAAWAAVKAYSALLHPDGEPLQDGYWVWWR